MAKRELKIWNGRGTECINRADPRWKAKAHPSRVHAYVCAYSRADARRVIAEYCGRMPPDSELRNYFCEGAWGNGMEGVTPERGLWLQFDRSEKPVRVV